MVSVEGRKDKYEELMMMYDCKESKQSSIGIVYQLIISAGHTHEVARRKCLLLMTNCLHLVRVSYHSYNLLEEYSTLSLDS